MEGEGEDDWGRGRGGRTAVAREGRMVEARWVGLRKKKEVGRKWRKERGRKEPRRPFSSLSNRRSSEWQERRGNVALLASPWARHLQSSQNALVKTL